MICAHVCPTDRLSACEPIRRSALRALPGAVALRNQLLVQPAYTKPLVCACGCRESRSFRREIPGPRGAIRGGRPPARSVWPLLTATAGQRSPSWHVPDGETGPAVLGRLPGVDVRYSGNPVLAGARRWLARVNARHPWNHNEHFHGWILRNLPDRRQAAVDVGCGTGVLAGKLAPHFACVTGIDADAGMAAAASARLAGNPRVTIRHCGFGQFAAAAGSGEADLITMVAVLHHLDLDDALAPIPGLLAPGGRLLVVGLARVNSLPDLAVDLASATANPVMGLIRHPRPPRPAEGPAAGQPAMPVRDPTATVAEISAAATARLPGAAVRRRLFFRYTLRWDKPPVPVPPQGPANSGNPLTARRPAGQRHDRRTPSQARADSGSPRRLQAADHQTRPLPIDASHAHRRRSARSRDQFLERLTAAENEYSGA